MKNNKWFKVEDIQIKDKKGYRYKKGDKILLKNIRKTKGLSFVLTLTEKEDDKENEQRTNNRTDKECNGRA